MFISNLATFVLWFVVISTQYFLTKFMIISCSKVNYLTFWGRINSGKSTTEIYSLQAESLQKVLIKKILLAHCSFLNEFHGICVTNGGIKVST